MKRSDNSIYLIAAVALFWLLCAMPRHAVAEKGDRDKPINITADKGSEDNKKQEAIFEGNVVLTQGTLRVEANRVVVHRDKDGFDYATATGAPARFRQKRDLADYYVEGFAQRIEYNSKNDIVEFSEKAKLTRGQDELTSNYIHYDSRTEAFQAFNPADNKATPKQDGERVKAVIQPKAKGPGNPTKNP